MCDQRSEKIYRWGVLGLVKRLWWVGGDDSPHHSLATFVLGPISLLPATQGLFVCFFAYVCYVCLLVAFVSFVCLFVCFICLYILFVTTILETFPSMSSWEKVAFRLTDPLLTYLHTYLHSYLCTCLSAYIPTYLLIYLPTCPYNHLRERAISVRVKL